MDDGDVVERLGREVLVLAAELLDDLLLDLDRLVVLALLLGVLWMVSALLLSGVLRGVQRLTGRSELSQALRLGGRQLARRRQAGRHRSSLVPGCHRSSPPENALGAPSISPNRRDRSPCRRTPTRCMGWHRMNQIGRASCRERV